MTSIPVLNVLRSISLERSLSGHTFALSSGEGLSRKKRERIEDYSQFRLKVLTGILEL
jgi:hypothetical protein